VRTDHVQPRQSAVPMSKVTRQRCFCPYCGCVIQATAKACRNHIDLIAVDPNIPLAAHLREAMAPQIGVDPA
jgi:hypothetical protein